MVYEMNRRSFLTSTAMLLLAKTALAQQFYVVPTGLTTFAALPIGAGGQITGLDIAPDGTMVCWTDVGGGYVWDGVSKWSQIFTTQTFSDWGAPSSASASFLRGTWSIAISPSNTNILWAISGFGVTYKSTNKGQSWTQTDSSLPKLAFNANAAPNGIFKFANQKIVVDPINSNHVIVGVPGQGVYRTTNGGTSWAQIAAIAEPTPISISAITFSATVGTVTVTANPFPAGKSGEYLTISGVTPSGYNGVWPLSTSHISGTQFAYQGASNPGAYVSGGQISNWGVPAGIVFDTTSGPVGGNTGTIYAASYDVGVFQSADGGVTWTNITGAGPTRVWNAKLGADGKYWCADQTDTWFYNGGWTKAFAGFSGVVAPDPSNANKIIISATATGGSSVKKTLDGGATWPRVWQGTQGSGTGVINRAVGDVPLLTLYDFPGFMTTGDMKYNPADGFLYYAEGTGVFKGRPPDTQVNWSWQGISSGIEEMVANDIISPLGGRALCAGWDRGVIRSPSDTTFPTTWGPGPSPLFTLATSVDYASDDPLFVAALSQSNIALTDQSGWSADGGQSWTVFGSVPSNVNSSHFGGCIAISTKGTDHTTAKIVWLPGNGVIPSYSNDGGATWTLSSGLPVTGLAPAVATNAHALVSDKVNGDFYLHCSTAGTTGGIYKSIDGGATWNKTSTTPTGPLSGNFTFAARLRSSPHAAGDIWATSGFIGGNQPTSEVLWRSIDSGVTWGSIANVKSVTDFGFGAMKQGNDYPSVFINGWVNQGSGYTWGVWRSDSSAAQWAAGTQTWTFLSANPNNSVDLIKTLNGSMNTWGSVYLGYQGTGYVVGSV